MSIMCVYANIVAALVTILPNGKKPVTKYIFANVYLVTFGKFQNKFYYMLKYG